MVLAWCGSSDEGSEPSVARSVPPGVPWPEATSAAVELEALSRVALLAALAVVLDRVIEVGRTVLAAAVRVVAPVGVEEAELVAADVATLDVVDAVVTEPLVLEPQAARRGTSAEEPTRIPRRTTKERRESGGGSEKIAMAVPFVCSVFSTLK